MQCMQGESNSGGISRVAFRAYVNRYYSGPGCQDITISTGEQSRVLCLTNALTAMQDRFTDNRMR